MTQVENTAVFTANPVQPTGFEGLTQAEILAKLQAAAAAKWGVANTAEDVEGTPEQVVKDATRAALARITVANTTSAVLNSEAYLTAVAEGKTNIDLDATVKKFTASLKSEVATISKGLQEAVTAKTFTDTASLDAFTVTGKAVEVVYAELPPLWKGAIVVIDFAKASSEAREKLASIGVGEAYGGFAVLTALTLDKTSGTIFAKVGGFNLAAGTVRISTNAVIMQPGINTAEVDAAYNAKIAQLESERTPSELKLNSKNLAYSIDKINVYSKDARFITALKTQFEDGTTNEQLDGVVASALTVLNVLREMANKTI